SFGGTMSESVAGKRFEGTVAVVTGSTYDPSIGRSCATRLAREGAAVVINGRTAEAVQLAEKEMRAEGLRVVGVAGSLEDEGMAHTTATKGMLDTQFSHAGADHPMGRLPHADDIADVACFLLSRDALMVTGQIIDVDAGAHLVGGWSPYTPPPA